MTRARRFTDADRLTLHQKVCAYIAEGQSRVQACKLVGINKHQWDTWLREGRVPSASYARAREERADLLVEEILTIADDPTLDPADKRARIDARKWIAARMDGKRWGDRLDLTSDGLAFQPIVALPAHVILPSLGKEPSMLAEVVALPPLPEL
jgi:hypothetical protein